MFEVDLSMLVGGDSFEQLVLDFCSGFRGSLHASRVVSVQRCTIFEDSFVVLSSKLEERQSCLLIVPPSFYEIT